MNRSVSSRIGFPAGLDKPRHADDPPRAGLSAEERRAYDQLARTYKQVDDARYMAARPQTLYGIADSRVSLVAWLLDHQRLGRRRILGGGTMGRRSETTTAATTDWS